MTLRGHLTSAVSLCVITLNLGFWIALAFPTSLVRVVAPGLRPAVHRALDAIYLAAVRVDDFWLRRVLGIEWSAPPLALDRNRSWIVVSNHVSWSDIFVLQSLFAGEGLVVKFLTKRELLALPVVGWILWTFEFPTLRRGSGRGLDEAQRKQRDFEALRAACRRAREDPVALVDFAEGTRATAARRAARVSPHRHLLPPRAGGFGALLDGLGDALAGVVDCTLAYSRAPRTGDPAAPPAHDFTFWEFLSGGAIRVALRAERIDPGEVPSEREARARWFDARWSRKDAWIDGLRHASSPRR